MEKKNEIKLFVHIIKINENDYELAGLSEDKHLWYVLPKENQKLEEHKTLLRKPTIKNAISAIRPINGYRKIGIKLDNELEKEYFDEDGNLSFKGFPLEEYKQEDGIKNSDTSNENFLYKRIQELEMKLNMNELKLHEVEKKFILNKFDKKQNSIEWMNQFENECSRHNIINETNKIEVLRFFTDGPSRDWYETNLKKIGLVNWSDWKNSFFTVFVDKGWSTIRKTYNFKYLGGSLVEYALTKERLCLEIERNITVKSRINMMVVGLPIEIQDELDREEITTIDELYIQLKKKDDTFNKKKKEFTNININKDSNKTKLKKDELKKTNNTAGKKPCFICEALGWPNRFHPSNECRNIDTYSTKKKVNLIEAKEDKHSDEAAEFIKIDVDHSLN